MLIFGHLGFGQLIARPWHQRLTWWCVALGSLLPDLLDKPLFLLFPGTYGGSRLYGHTLLFLIILAVIGCTNRSRRWISLAIGVVTHLVADNLGDPLHVEHATDASIRTLLWPLMGWQFPDAVRLNLESQIHRILSPYFVATELIGLLILVWFMWRQRIEKLRRD